MKFSVGDTVYSKHGTLAYIMNDRSGEVVSINGDLYLVEMHNSGNEVPFREDQLQRERVGAHVGQLRSLGGPGLPAQGGTI